VNRTQLKSPTGNHETLALRAVFMLLEVAGSGVDIREVVRDVINGECQRDKAGAVDMHEKIKATANMLCDAGDELVDLWGNYIDAGYELTDTGAGHSDEVAPHCSSLAALPPAVRSHVQRAHDRKVLAKVAQHDPELADMLASEIGGAS